MAFDDLSSVGTFDRSTTLAQPVVGLTSRTFALARKLMKTSTRNPVVNSKSIGSRAARVKKILDKYR